MTWSVAFTHPQSEERVIAQAAREGLITFAPQLRLTKRFAGRRWECREFVFPRYVFAHLTNGWYRLRNFIGVANIVTIGEGPALVRDEVIDNLRQRCGVDGFFITEGQKVWSKGQRLRIERGPFKDRIGIYDGMVGDERIRVLMQLLNAEVRVNIAKDDLVAV